MILNLVTATTLCAALFFSLVWIMAVAGAFIDTIRNKSSEVSPAQSLAPAFFWSVFYFLLHLR